MSQVFPSIEISYKEPRWGLRRAQLFFEHPILMGVCLGSVLALTHMVAGRDMRFSRRWMHSTMVAFTAALSLSSGPMSGVLLQYLLIGWNWMLSQIKARWGILIALILMFIVAVQLFAKRPLPNILVSFAFEQDSGYFRILIWEFGTQSVARHPLLGVGLGSWDRPSWMPPSIDMFWLYNAIIFGLPGGLLMMGFFIAAVIAIGRVRNLDQRHYDYRAAYLITMASFFVTGWMVHFWNGTYVFFLFMVGAGMWILDAPRAAEAPAIEGNTRSRPSRVQPRAATGRGTPAERRTPRSPRTRSRNRERLAR
ncbi:hypothetical protein PSQ19_01575 [Devosia algicola]|uniref:O-antigen ligase domain-containing protein n=1 Tax=Devosia algicola TaxID=3026418 RepID=A0ABY7YNR3_9HYPH|nr:hypothetical protein [Devosia algicola]WDR02943.1 hypothetical protein PSQ19_01575 [Devosia algicola]